MYNKQYKDKVYAYFLNRLRMFPYRRGWLKGDCPFCGKAHKFGVNLNNNRVNCFICGDHGSPIDTIMSIEKLDSYKELKVFLKVFEGIEFFERPKEKKVVTTQIELPKEYINIRLGTSRFGEMARNYLTGRGFDIDELSLKGYGYCREGRYQGYIIIPFFVGGQLVYFNTRKFFGNGPKYDNPTIEEAGVGKSIIVYNLDALYLYDTVYIMEGVLNAETMGDQGIATGGKAVSPKQLSMIIKSPVKNIILLLDPDAVKEAIEVGLELVNYKRLKLVYWEGKDDVNDLGKEETLRKVDKFDWVTYMDLLKLKNEQAAINTYH